MYLVNVCLCAWNLVSFCQQQDNFGNMFSQNPIATGLTLRVYGVFLKAGAQTGTTSQDSLRVKSRFPVLYISLSLSFQTFTCLYPSLFSPWHFYVPLFPVLYMSMSLSFSSPWHFYVLFFPVLYMSMSFSFQSLTFLCPSLSSPSDNTIPFSIHHIILYPIFNHHISHFPIITSYIYFSNHLIALYQSSSFLNDYLFSFSFLNILLYCVCTLSFFLFCIFQLNII